ncbi:MAG: hypothetical protein ABI190_12185 [Casimicrobiaceae bacterium]
MRNAGYAALCVAGAVILPWGLRRYLPAVAYAIPVAVNLALAALFAATLRPHGVPMIARFAQAERGELTPELADYARRLTWIWVAFFVATASTAAWLAAAGLVRAWIVFTTFGNYAAVALLFVGEIYYRRRRFAHYTHASPRQLWSHVRGVLRRRRGEPR